jgi:hypothetical protein
MMGRRSLIQSSFFLPLFNLCNPEEHATKDSVSLYAAKKEELTQRSSEEAQRYIENRNQNLPNLNVII